MRILSLEYVATQKNKKYLSLSHVPFKSPLQLRLLVVSRSDCVGLAITVRVPLEFGLAVGAM